MAARNLLLQMGGAPPSDWWTPLSLLEAIGAALWHGNVCAPSEALSMDELVIVSQVAIELLDLMIEGFESETISCLVAERALQKSEA